MSDLIINGIDHGKFDLEWSKRGGVVMLKKHLSKVTYVCNISGTLHVAQTLGQKVFNGESFANVSPRLLRMATPDECAEAGIEYIEPPAVWRDIESAQKDKAVQLYSSCIKEYHPIAYYDLSSNCWRTGNDTVIYDPTHWMPLPQPPKE